MQQSVTAPPITCSKCGQEIDGAVYFHRRWYAYMYDLREDPRCQACAERMDWSPRNLVDGLPVTLPCEVCGRAVAWMYRPPRRVFVCSDACERERINARRRVRHRPRACESCGESFIPTRSDAATCSDRCRQRLHRSRIAESRTFPSGQA